MDTPVEEQQLLQHITSHIAATQDEITIPGTLSSDTIAQVNNTWFCYLTLWLLLCSSNSVCMNSVSFTQHCVDLNLVY
jgi:hypothetical protein